MSTEKKWKNRLKQLLKVFLSALALYLVFSTISFSEVVNVYSNANWSYIFLAVLFFIGSKLVAAIRLNSFFSAINVVMSQLNNIKLYMLGMFYNIFVPGGIGGDGYKVYFINKHFDTKIKKSIAAVVLDRVIGLLVLLSIAIVLFSFIDEQYFPWPQWLIVFLLIPLYFTVRWILRRFFPEFGSIFHRVSGLSFLVQFLQLICALFILKAIHQQESIYFYLFVFLISSLAAAIPFTIGGAGARELTFLYASQIFPINVHVAIALSLTFYLITLLVSLSGFYYVFSPQSIYPALFKKNT